MAGMLSGDASHCCGVAQVSGLMHMGELSIGKPAGLQCSVDLLPEVLQDIGKGGLTSNPAGCCPHAGVDMAMLSGEAATESAVHSAEI